MNPESSFPDLDVFQSQAPLGSSQTPLLDMALDNPLEPEDGEDILIAKAATLMIDCPPSPEAPGPKLDKDGRLRYIQGVIQGAQAYIVTNLLGEGSQTLVQPQMVWTIGRNREAALPFQDRMMSRRHAVVLYVQDEGFYLLDLNSMNGSYVNGVQVRQRTLLQDGDYICLGTTQFYFFVSQGTRTLTAIHPEVFSRINNTELRSTPFIDYSALEELDISFNLNHS